MRRGLQAHVVGRTITAVRVHHPRAVRRHEAGPADLTARLLDARITGTDRRGKYLWLTLDTPDGGADPDTALVVHLGMSGQMLLGVVPRSDHVRISALLDDGTVLSFADQRTFGGWLLADLVTVDGSVVPAPVAHLARDPLDPEFDADAVIQESSMQFLLPVKGELRAVVFPPPEAEIDKFRKLLLRAGRGRIRLRVEMHHAGKLATVFEGLFAAAMRREGDLNAR